MAAMRFHRVTVSMLVPVGDDNDSYGKTPKAAAQLVCGHIREMLGIGSTAGLILDEQVVSVDPEPEPECGECGDLNVDCEIVDGLCEACRPHGTVPATAEMTAEEAREDRRRRAHDARIARMTPEERADYHRGQAQQIKFLLDGLHQRNVL